MYVLYSSLHTLSNVFLEFIVNSNYDWVKALNYDYSSVRESDFETNSGSPVVISDATTGIEVELIVKSDPSNPSNSGGGYLIIGWDQGSGFDLRMFGSAPFKPKFTTF